jgi:hypothetical protein
MTLGVSETSWWLTIQQVQLTLLAAAAWEPPRVWGLMYFAKVLMTFAKGVSGLGLCMAAVPSAFARAVVWQRRAAHIWDVELNFMVSVGYACITIA